ncbi:MAG: protein phosphatase 2C domain-containing protein [Myxococcota bacterium]|nr:protein phosphatase 2C domain-containing protein [Myxococcota bacterium]
MTTWIIAGVTGLVLVIVLVLLFGRRRDDSDARGASARQPAGAPQSGSERSNQPEGERGGSQLASNPPPAVGTASGLASSEIEISDAGFGPEIEEDEPTGPMPRILVTAVGQTDAGRRRKHNEDAYLVLQSHSLFAIADGMGGYAAGEIASQMAIDVVTAAFESGHFGGSPIAGLPRRGDELVRAIQSSNAAILKQARANEAQAGMGTTLVAARFSPNRKRVYIAHVGDSRLYRLRGDELEQLTEDHTLGAMGIQGPSANKLSRAVGVFDEVEVDLRVDEPHNGDYYILCSDGLSKMVPEPTIAELIRATSHDIDAAVRRLISEANERGGKDNVSVILIRVDEPVDLV